MTHSGPLTSTWVPRSDGDHISTSYAHSNNKFKIFLKEILGGGELQAKKKLHLC